MGLVTETRQEDPWYTHSQQAEAMSAKDRLALFNWQMNTGAISYGVAAYAYQQLQQSMGVKVTGQLVGKEARTKVPMGNSNDRDAPTGLMKIGKATRNISEPYADYYQLQLTHGKT